MIFSIKPTMIKKAALPVVAAFAFMCTAATVIADNTNLSGKWTLNESKSELGQFGGRMAAKSMSIAQTAEDLAIDRTSSFNGQERTTSEKLAFGKESENTVFGNNKRKSTSKWSDDGKTLTVTSTMVFERNGESMEIKSTDTYVVSEDGSVLTIQSTSTSSRGTNTMKLVYDKSK